MNKLLISHIKRTICVFFLMGMSLGLKAQDPQFTQFYAAPLYLNPAFAGASGGGRAIANYRNQWPGLDASFVTYAASYDQFFEQIRSGVGFMIKKDDQGIGAGKPITATDIAVMYSYHIPVNDKYAISTGLSLGYGVRALNFGDFIFEDQIIGPSDPLNPTSEQFSGQYKGYADVGSGFVLFSQNMWFGLSVSHLNKPNTSFLGGKEKLPRKLTVHTGYKISLIPKGKYNPRHMPPERSITPALMYLRQGASEQLSLGTYLTLDPLMLGVWYRGIPTKKRQYKGLNQDAVAILTGIRLGTISIGYSYDYTLSRLTNLNTTGSHEISITYSFVPKEKGIKKGNYGYPQILCPNPWKKFQKLKYEHLMKFDHF
ncbi:type IX secretion system membrane protein PorP/SprF [Flammeovirgaceae bacterium SG7u.111]|nr:type IX secretion system membrane protein PorP/SprF [Flammeovirgaceae bacterium SG7u.132]WPO38515.1 type IX secretion system membrane protein PorP/SprF [Flammeovirgaceae bacterium SG7u.111]